MWNRIRTDNNDKSKSKIKKHRFKKRYAYVSNLAVNIELPFRILLSSVPVGHAFL